MRYSNILTSRVGQLVAHQLLRRCRVGMGLDKDKGRVFQFIAGIRGARFFVQPKDARRRDKQDKLSAHQNGRHTCC